MDMKRFFAMILAAALLVCLFAACKGKKTVTQPSEPPTSDPTQTTPDPVTPTPTPVTIPESVTPTPVTPTPTTPTPTTPTPTPTPFDAIPLSREKLAGTWSREADGSIMQLIFTEDSGCAVVTCDPSGKPTDVMRYSYAVSDDQIFVSHVMLGVVMFEWGGYIMEDEDATRLHLDQDGEKVVLTKTSDDTTFPVIDEPTPTPVTPTPVTPTPVTPTPVTPTPVTPTPVTPTPVTPTPVTPTPVTPTPTPTPSENFAFYLEDAEASAGGEVTLNLKVRNSPGFAGFSVCVKYDPSKLSYESGLRKINNTMGTVNKAKANEGRVHLMATVTNVGNTLSDGLYYTITFKVNGSLSAGEKIPVELVLDGDLDTVYTYDKTTKQSTEIACELYGCTITVK